MCPLPNVVQRHAVSPWALQGVLSRSYPHSLVAHRPDTDGFERLLPSVVPGVLPVVPPLSGHPSSALDGILVVCYTGMGAELSYFSPSLSQIPQVVVGLNNKFFLAVSVKKTKPGLT
ncbi:hypothetical protein DSO57_1038118 [Entomophthora muscae]|uniref:Uncharacterized protein n=1 Tax=Entomophthora muscae TaxID=34485 RepID=A0ACC2U8E7_9FUNG|nr:hypothetical protein DSO57_1038118 [Entomophthora muscae]